MKRIERITKHGRAKAKRRRVLHGDIARAILGVVGAVSVLGVAMVAPNALKALDLVRAANRRRREYYIEDVRLRLVREGYMTAFIRRGEIVQQLTQKGKRRLERERWKSIPTKKAGWRWDGIWHVVIFDIKEIARGKRDRLRRELIAQNFIRLQQSIWVSPYNHEALLDFLKIEYGLSNEVIYMKVAHIENDHDLRAHFKLPDAKS